MISKKFKKRLEGMETLCAAAMHLGGTGGQADQCLYRLKTIAVACTAPMPAGECRCTALSQIQLLNDSEALLLSKCALGLM